MARQKYRYRVESYPERKTLWVGESPSAVHALAHADQPAARHDVPGAAVGFGMIHPANKHQATHLVTGGGPGTGYFRRTVHVS